jgi:hypothetical protein
MLNGIGLMVCNNWKIYLILFIVFGGKRLGCTIFLFCRHEQENIKVLYDTSLPKEGMSEAYCRHDHQYIL